MCALFTHIVYASRVSRIASALVKAYPTVAAMEASDYALHMSIPCI